MNRLFVLLSALLTCGMLSAQEARQLAHRKINMLHSRVESHQKEKLNLSYTTIHYDRKGRETAVFEFNADSVCIQAEFFEYNKNGKLTLHTTVDSLSHSRSRLEQRYDKRNLLQEKTLFIDGKQKERTVYTYNTLDDRICEQVFDDSIAALTAGTVHVHDALSRRGRSCRRAGCRRRRPAVRAR